MIIKKQDLPSDALAELITFINGSDCVPADTNFSVVSLKCVNPGSEKGLYSVDIEFNETYVAFGNQRSATDSKLWLRIYDFLSVRCH